MAAKVIRARRGRPVEVRAPRKKNLLTTLGLTTVDYKDVQTLRLFLSDRGKIRSRHITGLTVRQQRQVAVAVKNAREMALLPYTASPGR